jgi:hypothetical protein
MNEVAAAADAMHRDACHLEMAERDVFGWE